MSGIVGSGYYLEHGCAQERGSSCLGMQTAQTRREIVIVKRNDNFNALTARSIQQCPKTRGRAQFNIDISRVRQKTAQQLTPDGRSQIVFSPFRGMPRCNNIRGREPTGFLFKTLGGKQAIKSKLEQIRRIRHLYGQAKLGEAGDHSNSFMMGLDGFDRFERRHILMILRNAEE